MKAIKQSIQIALNKLGYEIKKKTNINTYQWLTNEGIQTVLDIGANRGQFARTIHDILYDAHIYSFEPLKSCFCELQYAVKDKNRFSCFNFALGEDNCSRLIFHNEFSPSSSMLPVEELHKSAFPFASACKEELIKVRRLDDIVAELKLSDNILIKIDVQGFEDKVIRGGEKTIKKSKIIIVETSVETLYQGQPLFNDIYSLLVGCGFSFKGAEEPLRHPQNGRILQFDSIFINNIFI